MATSRVSSKGSVVIPLEIRKKYGIEPGDEVSFVDYGGALYVWRVPEDPIAAMRGMFAGGPSMTEALVADRRAEAAEDERKVQEDLRRGAGGGTRDVA